MRMLRISLALALLLASPCLAVSGHIGMDYDLLTEEWVWDVGLEKGLTDNLVVGTTLSTTCPDYGYKGIIPSWIPELQRYEVWAEVRWKEVSVRLTDWCDHYLSQSGKDDDKWGLKLSLRYSF